MVLAMEKKERKICLVILAAGIGRRFGGIKQLSSVGPNGETIIDYSLYDALKAGFNKVIFIIRRSLEADFREIIGRFWENLVEVDYAFQELNSLLPEGWPEPAHRTKPWGTGHALLVTREKVKEPFAVINADDFYGRRAFEVMAGFLKEKIEFLPAKGDSKPEYGLVGYRLKQTLSDFGPVCRGLCELRGEELSDIREMKHIEKKEAGARAYLEDGHWLELSGEEVVSMNFWGFEPSIFDFLATGFLDFLKHYGHDSGAEFLIPDFVGELIRQEKIRVHCLPVESRWFGVTYPEDLSFVRQGIAELISKGDYPRDLKFSLKK